MIKKNWIILFIFLSIIGLSSAKSITAYFTQLALEDLYVTSGSTVSATDSHGRAFKSPSGTARTMTPINLQNIADQAGETYPPEVVNKYWHTVKEAPYSATGDGTTNDYIAINSAIIAIGSDNATLYFPSGSYYTTNNLSFGNNIELRFDEGASLKPASGIVISVGGSITSTNTNILDISLSGSFTFGTQTSLEIIPQWFGFSSSATATVNTTALQTSLELAQTHGKLKLLPGNYLINDTITASFTATATQVNLIGCDGFILTWSGSGSKPVINFKGVTGGGYYTTCTIENIKIVNGNLASDLIGIQLGTSGVSNAGVGNVTINKNEIIECAKGIVNYFESDEMSCKENYIAKYTTTGIESYSNALVIEKNHLQAGATSSIGINVEGASVYIKSNIIQSSEGITGIQLTDVYVFSVNENYIEALASCLGKEAISLINCNSGNISENKTNGMVGGTMLKIDATCENITIGANRHTISGGSVTLTDIDSSAIQISFIGTFSSSAGCDFPDNVNVRFKADIPENFTTGTGSRTVSKIFNSIGGDKSAACYGSFVNISGISTKTIFTAVAGSCYIVHASQGVEDYAVSGIVHVPLTGSTAEYTELQKTNANLIISTTGLEVQAENGISATRTIQYGAIRIY